ncbi:hypothetical protein RFI_31810 [Reticulomyxa filosa]|uniref:Uncharacterized protein n=1 Tax=Reticulomyxa filosa TaxID=46433 RepID=X6LWR7_RETFI|nr:hypothetical protein RFI_31810 [Reticulomyxa filosa]|eukprot:ETO05587.1 hypothetical protein RFI_31810 [Reticulomyxa filosa]
MTIFINKWDIYFNYGILYCGKSCNVQFSYDQIQFRHHNWPYLDCYLWNAINILHSHERREGSEMELYCGLKNVRLENIKEIKFGFFISRVSNSDDIQVEYLVVISPFKHKRKILFAREQFAWNAKIDSEDEYTQMILLTWVQYDQYIQQTMKTSAMPNHYIDFDLIYVALHHCCENNISKMFKLLLEFKEWKLRDNHEQNYKKRKNF